MSVTPSPIGGFAAQFFDNNGVILSGGKIYTYAAGTTTPQASYTSALGITPHANPIILDSAGRVPGGEIWLTDGLIYKFVIETALAVLIGTYDNITGVNSNFVNYTIQEEVITATAGQTVFNLSTINYTPGTNSLSVYIDGVNQYVGDSYLETDSDTVTFTSGVHVGGEVKFTTAVQTTTGAIGADAVGYDPPFTGSVPTNVEDKLAQYVSVKDFGAVGDGVANDTAAINAAIAAANGGVVNFPKGEYRITSTITVILPGTSLIGEGSESTKITNDSAVNAIVFGNGSIEMAGCTLQGLTIEGDNASGIGFWGRIFASGSGMNDVQVIGGSIGLKLDVCYAMRMYNVRVRSTVGDGIQANAQCHNTMLIGSKVQVCGGHGLSINGCYAFYVDGSNFEFNQQNQVYVTSPSRGGSIRGCYFEGIMPTSGGYAGVYVNDCDSLVIDGCYFDATQTGIEGTNGTGTYLKAINGSRIDYKNNGFASIAASQTHVNFAATVSSGTATVPLGATYVNSTQNCRIYNDVKDEIGTLAYSTVAQTYTTVAWNDLIFSTELYDPKAELNAATGVFTPKDYGVYTFNVSVGVAALAVDKAIYVRLLDSTNASTLAQYQVYNPTAATDPVFNITFTEFLDKAFSYKLQLFNDDTVNRNSVPGRATHRCSFKRIG